MKKRSLYLFLLFCIVSGASFANHAPQEMPDSSAPSPEKYERAAAIARLDDESALKRPAASEKDPAIKKTIEEKIAANAAVPEERKEKNKKNADTHVKKKTPKFSFGGGDIRK